MNRTPPYNELSWTPSPAPLGSRFRGYRVYAAPLVSPAPPWHMLADIDVPAWLTPATAEAQLTKFRDYMAGWGGTYSPWSAGWRYVVTARDDYYLESKLYGATIVSGAPNPDVPHWLTSNECPYLNCPIPVRTIDTKDNSKATTVEDGLAGRDYAFTRTRVERAGSVHSIDWYYHSLNQLAEERARWPTAIKDTGQTMAFLVPDGDRTLGTLTELAFNRDDKDGTIIKVDAQLTQTQDWLAPSWYNLPCGLVTNGTNQSISTNHNANLNPLTGEFTIAIAAAFNGTSGKIHLSKRGATDGYEIKNTAANTLGFLVDGATSADTVAEASTTWSDGKVHTAIGSYGTEPGAARALKLYRDGVLKASKIVANLGTISNTDTLDVAWDGGATYSLLNPLQSWAYYPRRLTDYEAEQLSGYFQGWSGYKAPGGATVFYDVRDDRCYSPGATILEDLAGNFQRANVTGTPTPRGAPWRLRELDTLVPVS